MAPAPGRGLELAVALLLASACTTTVVPPESPEDPVSVRLADHGRHASLFLPAPREPHGATWVEYAYGEWRWFALHQASSTRVFPTLFWPTAGTLRRGVARRPPEDSHELRVSGAACRRLLEELDAEVRARSSTRIVDPTTGLEYVRTGADYHAFHNCNTELASWLEALGCRVSGSRLFSSWRVTEPALAAASEAE